MIRNAMFGLSLIAFSAGSAFAGNVKHAAKTPVVAAAVAGDAAKTEEKPAEAAPAKKDKKATKKEKAPKAEKTEGKTEMKADAPVTK
jgi:hypothetical protein